VIATPAITCRRVGEFVGAFGFLLSLIIVFMCPPGFLRSTFVQKSPALKHVQDNFLLENQMLFQANPLTGSCLTPMRGVKRGEDFVTS
jgi:hypothetical protein